MDGVLKWATILGAELSRPSALLLLALLMAVILECIRPRRASRIVALLCSLLLGACAWGPLATWLIKPLEERFPRRALPPLVKGIIVIGGAFNVGASARHGTISLNFRAERMIAFAGLARKYPQAKLVFSGGSAIDGSPTEARFARVLFAHIGLPRGRIIFEDKSRNTHENALFSYRLLRPREEDRWLLVTSAADMPRAVGAFWRVGWRVIPAPVDFHADSGWWAWPGLADGLTELDWATHEWIGLAYYRFRGWTDELLPGPGLAH